MIRKIIGTIYYHRLWFKRLISNFRYVKGQLIFMKSHLILTLVFLSIQFCMAQKSARLDSLYSSIEYEQAIELGREMLVNVPTDPTVNHILGRALADTKKYSEAKPYLLQSADSESPEWMQAWSYAYLGICEYISDNKVDSKVYLEKTLALNATKNSNKFAQNHLNWFQMTEYFEDWQVVEKEHIRFYFQPNHGIENLNEYCDTRENAYQINNQFFEAEPYKKIDYFVWSKPKDAIKIVGKNLGFADSDLCKINSSINQTIGHEMTHILCDFGMKPTNRNRLINEGVAVAFDLSHSDKMKAAIRTNTENLGIKDIYERAEELPEAYIYPVGGAFIEYLLKNFGDEKLKSLLRDQSWNHLIELYGTEVLAEFDKKIKS